MMTQELGKLESVNLRDVWKTEAGDFTPWLAQEENLKILGDAIGIELEFVEKEKGVGPFRADILCKDTADDSWVLIENQIEKTDHRHLGQLLTYAAGLKAVTIIWIADRFTEEHRAALDWLNSITGDDFRFFGLEVELWKIGDSIAAPKFNTISKPNDWSKTIAQTSEQPITKTMAMQLRYWTEFSDFLEQENSQLKIRTPRPRHWYDFGIGRTKFRLTAFMDTTKRRIGINLIVRGKEVRPFFSLLQKQKEAIGTEIGGKLLWISSPNKRQSRITLYNDIDPTDETGWKSQYAWFKEKLELFDKAFRDRIKNLNAEDWDPNEEDDEDGDYEDDD